MRGFRYLRPSRGKEAETHVAIPRLIASLAALAAAIGLAACGGGGATAAHSSSGVDARLDAALARGARHLDTPGATASIVKDGKVVWAGAYGRARAGRRAAMRTDTMIPIASATKTVTATMGMALAEHGQLGLGQRIARWLPRLPGSRRITVRMLMNHSSGLEDYFSDGALDRTIRHHPFHRWKRGEVLAHVHRLLFRPGTRHHYSNSNYVALGGVITRASHRGVQDLFQRYVAGPLHLSHSTYRYGGAPQSELAHPLRPLRGGGVRDKFGANGSVTTDYWGEVWTDGGLATTPSDLARFGNALCAGPLLPPSWVEKMLPHGTKGWGLGTFGRRALGSRWFGHDGWYGGFQTENWTDPKRGLTIDVFSNRAGGKTVAAPLWREVAAAYLR
jgi:D-alanyl-D-alanine carboxypeptidase